MTDTSATLSAPQSSDDFDPFAAGAVERVVDTTEAQREVWLGDRLGPQSSLAYNESMRLRLRGALDRRALAAALDRLLARHESLRATISPDGAQLLVGEPRPLALATQDLRALDGAAQARRLAEAGEAVVLDPFLLEQGPLFRATLYALADDDHLLEMSAHHAVCDGWSWGVISHDLGSLYAEQLGSGPALAPAAQYSDYAAWEAESARGPEMQSHVDYWLTRFSGSSLPVLELPLDRPRPPVRAFDSRRIDHVLDQSLVDALRRLGAASGTSLFATLFGGFAALLHRLTAQDDLVIGIAAAGQMAADMPSLVGHCVNLLPLRVQVEPTTPFDALARQSGSTLLDAFEHQNLTYGALLKKLPLPRDASRLPLVNVLFNVDRDGAPDAGNFPGLRLEQSTIPRRYENFELFLNLTPVAGGMQIEAQYSAGLFDDPTVRRWLGMYDCLLRAAVRQPGCSVGRLDVLSPAEAHALAALQPAASPLPGAPLMHAGFVAQAAARPESPALRDGELRIGYRELDERSNRLAHLLRARGVGRGQRVGLCLDRGIDMFVALLAVLKSGAAYVPLDPAFPQARLDYYAEDAQPSVLLTASTVAVAPSRWCADAASRVVLLDRDTAWREGPAHPLPPGPMDPQAEDTAYVIYTSGSTGQPKGVCVPHRAAANLMRTMQREPGIGPQDRIAATTTLSFDMAVPEVMLPLAAGAEIVIVKREVAMDGNRLRALLESADITILQAVPGMWRLLIDAQWSGPRGFRAWTGAEPVPADLALELLERASEVWTLYGPTETTVWSTVWRVDAERVRTSGVSIGRPMDNTAVWILDADLQRCPVGVPGEICIAGMGVTLGYLGRPELSAERFVVATIDGVPTPIYRSGDRGRWRNDGLLEHLGRFDFQVKVRGYRIELGEIEARCNETPGVARSVVITREDQPGDVRLVAYLAPSAGATIDLAELDARLRARLPQYMVPQHVVVLEAIPLLPNGKVDRKALPKPSATRSDATQRLAPRNERERTVLAAMERVLNLPGLGVRDDFFSLGGHSLLAARLTTQLSREFDRTVPLRTLFEAPTAERLSAAIDALLGRDDAPRQEVIRHVPDRVDAPLTPMQERVRFIEELHPGRTVYSAPSGHRLHGPLDVARFERALDIVVQRQPALRSMVRPAADGTGHVLHVVDGLHIELPFEDLRALPRAEREAELALRMQRIVDEPIDIHAAPMCRVALYRVADDEHVFVFNTHHLIWDGWSFDLLYVELADAYGRVAEGLPSALEPLPVTYADYADWYARWLKSPACEAQLQFWKERFRRSAPTVAPQTDRPRGVGMSGTGGTEWVEVDTTVSERLRAVARQHDVTLNMLAFALYATMMASVVETDAVVIALPVRGRPLAELEPVMGFFNNVLAVPVKLEPAQGLGEFLAQVKQALVEAMSHQDVPFEIVATQPEVAARSHGAGLYHALFSWQDTRARPRHWGALEHEPLALFQKGATDDLGLWLLDGPKGLQGGFTYNADIYLRSTAQAFRARFLEILARAAGEGEVTMAALLSVAGSESAAALRHLSHRAAPAPLAARPADTAPAAVAPAPSAALSDDERSVAGIWATLLGIPVADIRRSDNFFDLGGDSLVAMRAIEQTAAALGFRVEARRYVFESLGQLASRAVASTPAAAPSPGLLGRVLSTWRRKA